MLVAGQLSFFSASALPPTPADLAGALCGPAQVVRKDGSARVSVVLADSWRVDALVAELGRRELAAEVHQAQPSDGWSPPAGEANGLIRSVRTEFSPDLVALANSWGASGAGKRAPADLVLDGPALRLWYVVAGRGWEAGHALGLGENDERSWAAVGAALVRAGLPAAFVGPRGEGPAYRLVGERRRRRLAELVGDPPSGWPPQDWPS